MRKGFGCVDFYYILYLAAGHQDTCRMDPRFNTIRKLRGISWGWAEATVYRFVDTPHVLVGYYTTRSLFCDSRLISADGHQHSGQHAFAKATSSEAHGEFPGYVSLVGNQLWGVHVVAFSCFLFHQAPRISTVAPCDSLTADTHPLHNPSLSAW
jgi:hypothetical protein